MEAVLLRAPTKRDADGIAGALNAPSRSLCGGDEATGDEIRTWFGLAVDAENTTGMRVARCTDTHEKEIG